MSTVEERAKRDEERLAQLGYKQDLQRAWSGFSNFAISFTIISVLAGCFTTYGQAWSNGGPIAISWGWPIICGFILLVAFSMAELVSAYPTAGGIYWWASELGGKAWGWFTGWFNLIGLIGIVASVDYAAATFLNYTLGLYGFDFILDLADDQHVLAEQFVLFALILGLHALINIYSSRLVALFNNISVGWHVLGVAVIVAILVLVPSDHQSADFVFTDTNNLNGFGDGMFWYYVLPVGFLLTMYTVTGYDASAHVSEETHAAAESAPKGVWRSVFYSAVIGWIVLLAMTFAATDTQAIDDAFGFSPVIFDTALGGAWAKTVMIISTTGQLFCGMACVTSASRMMYAFSRDRAVPGWRVWTKLNHHRIPMYSVLGVCAGALVMTLPALEGDENNFPYAFFAVVAIGVIALYIAYVIPVFLRWRKGDAFRPGPWTLGRKYRWINATAVIWVGLCVIMFSLPFAPTGVPWRDEFDWKYVNYAPITVGLLFAIVGIWWLVSARRKFTGPVRQVQTDPTTGAVIDRVAS
jgi:amino acid transporter